MCKTPAPVSMEGQLQPLADLNLEEFKCSECPQRFRLQSLLRRHFVRVHNGRSHVCSQCGHVSRNAGELHEHVLTHQGKTFQCPKCPNRFTTNRSLIRHSRTFHKEVSRTARTAPVKIMECAVCELKFNTKTSWNKHIALHSAAKARASMSGAPSGPDENSPPEMKTKPAVEVPYRCEVCGAAFQSQSSWIYHINCAHKEPNSTCVECGLSFPNAETLQEHSLALHVVHACGRCGEKFSSYESLQQHSWIHGDDPYVPSTDHYQPSFNQTGPSSSLYDLSAIHYEPSTNHYSSSVNHFETSVNHYDASANHYATSVDHYDASANNYDTSNNHCEPPAHHRDLSVHSFDPSADLFNPADNPHDSSSYPFDPHVNPFEHPSTTLGPLGDPLTPSSNPDDSLKITAPKKSSDKTFFCDMCQMSFCSKSSLQRHCLTHSKEKIFPCTECSLSFTSSTQLGRHLRVHGLKKPYKCSDCDRSFKLPTNLRKHSLTHSKISSSYVCTICAYKCRSVTELTRHMLVHSLDKQYECEGCHRRYLKLEYLKRHFATAHPHLVSQWAPQTVVGNDVDVKSDSGVCVDGGDFVNGSDFVSSGDFIAGGDCVDCDDFVDGSSEESACGDPFLCSLCHKVFSKRNTLIRHLDRHLERWQSKC